MALPAGYTPFHPSTRNLRVGARRVGPADPTESLTVTVRVRRPLDAPALPPPGTHLSRAEFARRYSADAADIAVVARFASEHGLSVGATDPVRRTVSLAGTVAQMNAAFAVTLNRYECPGETYRGREGTINLPAALAQVVEGVFGLDDRRMAQRIGVSTKLAQGVATLTPPQVAKLYGFPTNSAAGQTIGLLEFGGGYTDADTAAYFKGLGLATPTVVSSAVDGASNTPSGDASDEVALDIDVAGSVAQGAKIAVYFAPWTEQGWIDVVTTAVHDAASDPSVLSISWGWTELEDNGFAWTQQAIDAVSATFAEAAALGVTVFVASGDDGSNCQIGDGKAHVYYPASDPGIVSCGGTSIKNVAGASFSETTWNDDGVTGGGISDVFDLPAWQKGAKIPPSVNAGARVGRGIPDIAGFADGYNIELGGKNQGPYVGTSETAPLYAALFALLNAHLKKRAGFVNPLLYQLGGTGAFHDVADGGSNAVSPAPGYTAGPGWDACTGWGRLDATVFSAALAKPAAKTAS